MDLTTATSRATRARLVARFGDGIEPWWQALPTLVDDLAEHWQVALGDPVGRGGTSIVLACRTADGSSAYLKLTPESTIVEAEAAALDHWHPSGRVPAVRQRDLGRGALLLEGVGDGQPLAITGEAPSLEAVGGLIGALHAVGGAPDGFPPLEARVRFIFDRLVERYLATSAADLRDRVDAGLLRRGLAAATRLAAGAETTVLLHGDLHPGNVLSAAHQGLMAIDPRPHVGDPAFDLVDWIPWQAAPDEWAARCTALATRTGNDPDRTWAWFGAFAGMLALIEIEREGAATCRAEALLAIAPD